GLTVDLKNPFAFDFYIDQGDVEFDSDNAKNQVYTQQIKYFLAALTVPEEEMWVNLSPYEKDRMIPDKFGATLMGRDLLAQDYILKKLTASLMYPEKELGERFWSKVYNEAFNLFNTTEIPMQSFNKVWIMPDKAVVYEHNGSAFVVESHLKVLMEEDYYAQKAENGRQGTGNDLSSDMSHLPSDQKIIQRVMKEIIIPAIEKEVNEGKSFANLRQIYHAMILASWYKTTLNESLLGQIYVNQHKINGIELEDEKNKDEIFKDYVRIFQKGVFDFVKEEFDENIQELIERRYVSGGAVMEIKGLLEINNDQNIVYRGIGQNLRTFDHVQAIAEYSGDVFMKKSPGGILNSAEEYYSVYGERHLSDSEASDIFDKVFTEQQRAMIKKIESIYPFFDRDDLIEVVFNEIINPRDVTYIEEVIFTENEKQYVEMLINTFDKQDPSFDYKQLFIHLFLMLKAKKRQTTAFDEERQKISVVKNSNPKVITVFMDKNHPAWGFFINVQVELVASLLNTFNESLEKLVVVSEYPETIQRLQVGNNQSVKIVALREDQLNQSLIEDTVGNSDLLITYGNLQDNDKYRLFPYSYAIHDFRRIFTKRESVDRSPDTVLERYQDHYRSLGLNVPTNDTPRMRTTSNEGRKKIFVSPQSNMNFNLMRENKEHWVGIVQELILEGFDVVVNVGSNVDSLDQFARTIVKDVEDSLSRQNYTKKYSLIAEDFSTRENFLEFMSQEVMGVITVDSAPYWISRHLFQLPTILISTRNSSGWISKKVINSSFSIHNLDRFQINELVKKLKEFIQVDSEENSSEDDDTKSWAKIFEKALIEVIGLAEGLQFNLQELQEVGLTANVIEQVNQSLEIPYFGVFDQGNNTVRFHKIKADTIRKTAQKILFDEGNEEIIHAYDLLAEMNSVLQSMKEKLSRSTTDQNGLELLRVEFMRLHTKMYLNVIAPLEQTVEAFHNRQIKSAADKGNFIAQKTFLNLYNDHIDGDIQNNLYELTFDEDSVRNNLFMLEFFVLTMQQFWTSVETLSDQSDVTDINTDGIIEFAYLLSKAGDDPFKQKDLEFKRAMSAELKKKQFIKDFQAALKTTSDLNELLSDWAFEKLSPFVVSHISENWDQTTAKNILFDPSGNEVKKNIKEALDPETLAQNNQSVYQYQDNYFIILPDSQMAKSDLGGIDLNPGALNLEIRRDGYGAPLPLPFQTESMINIEGLTPVIIKISPMQNIQWLLGLT
ncbi:MAG: hypothetical protein KC713_06305, partial [Candidatus Omnitrophica bacterium]|nr:hypothetical protein [Candidatus Omnitrophota bacterium]